MVRAIEGTGFRSRIRLHDAVLRGKILRQHIFQFRCAITDDDHVMRPADRQGAVHIDAGDDLVQRNSRVLCEVFRTQQAGFFQCDRQEHDRTVNRLCGHGLCDFKQGGCAGCIVDRAIEDLILIEVFTWGTGFLAGFLAEVVPVCRIQNIFVWRRLAWQDADDVMAGQWFDRLGDLAFRFQACQRNRLEARFLGCVLQRLIVQSSSLEEFFRLVAGDPGFHRGAIFAAVGTYQIRLRTGPGVCHDIPAIGGRGRFVHDNCSSCMLTCGFFIFVGPAAIVGHGLAFEEVRILRCKAGIVDENDHGLAGEILISVVVPVIFRGDCAIANKDDVARIDGQFCRVLVLAPDDRIFFQFGRDLSSVFGGEGKEGCSRVDGLVHHLHFLKIGSIVASRLKAKAGHFSGDPVCSCFPGRCAGAAAFERVIRQRLDADCQVFRPDFRNGVFRQGQ